MNAVRRIDVDALLAQLDIAEVITQHGVELKRAGSEFKACCPFHDERTPSFTVVPAKQFFHCFGCGENGNAIAFVMKAGSCDFLEAVRRLGGESGTMHRVSAAPAPRICASKPETLWVPLSPVPEDALPLLHESGRTRPIYNPKRAAKPWVEYSPERVDAYRDEHGRLLGYVLRLCFDDRETGKCVKVTPMVTFCVGPDGARRWCTRHFDSPRPLCGLDDLARRPEAPVLIVEGEKCRAAAAGALPMYVAIAWPGGCKGIRYVDWAPLKDREVVLWPDADAPGVAAMLGSTNRAGDVTDGVAQYLTAAGARSIRVVDVAGRPKGWDIADALDVEGWSPRQVGQWAATRVRRVEVRG